MKKIDLHGKLATTVVGSFPLTDSKENMKKAINDQINANIDLGLDQLEEGEE